MIGCLVAIDKNHGIGFQNSMPWPYLKGDMEWFKKTTNNNIVVMGSNTWKSIGKKLPNRINVVISKNNISSADHTFDDPVRAIYNISTIYPEKSIFVIGGQKLYESTLSLIDIFYVTHIEETYECDRFFDFEYVQKNHTSTRELFFFDKTDKSPSYIIREYLHDSSRNRIS